MLLSENISHERKQLDIPTNLKLTEEHMNPVSQKNQAVIFFANAGFPSSGSLSDGHVLEQSTGALHTGKWGLEP